MIERHLGACRRAVTDGWIPVGEGRSDPNFAATPERSVLLLGEDNPQSSRPEHALYDDPPGCAGHRLRARVLGLTSDRYLSIWRTNLCNPTWSDRAARDRAEVLLGIDAESERIGDSLPWRTIVLLGAKVSRIVGSILRADLRPFTTWVWPLAGLNLVSLPHPSGRSHVWNEPDRYEQARAVMRDVVPEIPWGEAW